MDDQDDIPKEWADPRYREVVAYYRRVLAAARRGGIGGCTGCRGIGAIVMVDRSVEPYRPYSAVCGCALAPPPL